MNATTVARAIAALTLSTAALVSLPGCQATDAQSKSRQIASASRPMSVSDLALLKETVLMTDADIAALRKSRVILEPHLDELLGVWYGFVGSKPHLLASFSHPTTNAPDTQYLERVRERFAEWVLTTADANFDDAWLAHQLELGRRHHRIGKNRTDNVVASDHIQLRYVVALQYPIVTTLRPFLERGNHPPEEVDAMHEAWRKAVLLTSILWSQPYVAPIDF